MRSTIVLFICLASLVGYVEAAETIPEETRQKIEIALREFNAGMASDDSAQRIAAVETYFLDRSALVKLLGDDSGDAVWKKLEPELTQAKTHLRKNKGGEPEKGSIRKVEVRDMRENATYRDTIVRFPKDIGVYDAIIENEKGGGRMQGIIILDGKVKFAKPLFRKSIFSEK
ncbi:MAG: hypothetical protein QM811_08925 [Pirellulales bacterium]